MSWTYTDGAGREIIRDGEAVRRFAIRFDFPDNAPVYAGDNHGAAGFAPQLDTAFIFTDHAAAERVLANAYGDETQRFGVVVDLEEVSDA